MKTRMLKALGVLSALSIMAGPAWSAGEADADALRCVDLVRIDHTQVVDEQNILFYLRNGNIYLNQLSHRAPGLSPNRPIMFRTSTGRLCNHDTVTVLDTWGFGFTQRTSSASACAPRARRRARRDYP